MWSVTVFLAVWITLSLGITVTPRHKGCFSTNFVQQYAFYYRLNTSLPLQECIAACNNRLTRYMGLEVDERSPAYNYVFCGNDLAEVSPKIPDGQCNPCQENRTYSCGRNGTMSLYLIRDSTPLSLLLATDHGVEMLSDNVTTLRVAYYNASEYKSFDYIYTEDMIVSAISTSFLRSFYNPLTMKYSQNYIFETQSYSSPSLAVDFLTRYLYYGYKSNRHMYRGTTQGSYLETDILLAHRAISYPDQISIDPYNRSLVFLEIPTNTVNILTWNSEFNSISLNFLHVEKINALAMDIQEKLLYAILTFNGDSSTYLVSLDYEVSQMRVLFNGPQLVNATVLEVFRDDAVWLSNLRGVSTIFQCKLTPRCQVEDITVHHSNKRIYDFSIYHPEKQTPGKQRLCATMTCSHGCQLFSPFTARCSCPPGMEVDPDNNSCIWVNYSTETAPSTSSALSINEEVNHELFDSYETSINAVDSTSIVDFSTSLPEVNVYRKSKKNIESAFSFNEILTVLGICIIVILFLIVLLLCILVPITIRVLVDLKRKTNRTTPVLGQSLEMKCSENHYVEIPLN